QNADAFIFSRDLKSGKIIYASSNFEKIFDRSLKDYISNPGSFLSFVHPEDVEGVKANHKALIEHGTHKDEEFRVILPDKSIKWVWSRVYVIEDAKLDTPILVGMIQDITRKKRITEKASSDNPATGMLNELIHDLKTPFNSIMGLTQIMELDFKKLEGLQQYLDLIKRNCEYSLGMLDDMLIMAEIDTIKDDELEIEGFRLEEIIENVKLLFNSCAVEKRVSLIINDNGLGDYCIKANKTYLTRVVSNLLSNALKFTGEGGRIDMTAEKKAQTLEIAIKDNGIGIPENLHSYIFDKFSKAKRSGLNQEKPNGLGLHIAQKLIEIQGGTLTFNSKENHGSTFFIRLPI
ncbi:MAG: PAS domain-containing sensor histidine kinase, partial [Bacteroidota bacterium]